MAQSFTDQFATYIIPGAYNNIQVQQPTSGPVTSGVVVLLGEASAGPDFSLETDITTNFFGPDQEAAVLAKYKSGPVVDAFKNLIVASNDPNLQGSVSRVFILKSNSPLKASAALVRSGLSNYATLADQSYGDLGNQIYSVVSTSQVEVVPTTGAFTFVPSPSSATLGLRVNGQATQSLAISAKTAPSAFVGSANDSSNTSLNSLVLSSLNTILATGGVNRNVLSGAVTGGGGNTLAVSHSGNTVVITLGAGSGISVWATTPSAGDTLLIPQSGEYGAGSDSSIVGAGDANAGAYVVTAATGTTISATKLRNNVSGALVAPVNVSAAVLATTKDVEVFSPVVVTNASGVNRGLLAAGNVGQTIAGVNVSGQNITFQLQSGDTWAALPQAGDLLLMPSTAPGAFLASGANAGWYQVVSATSSTLSNGSQVVATRLSNGAPVAFVATAVAAVTDLQCFRPMIPGVGKALELFDNGGSENVGLQLYTTSGSLVTWLSTLSAPSLFVSASEYEVQVQNSRTLDNSQETLSNIGGDVVLLLGYNGGFTAGVTGSCTVANVNGVPTLTTSVTGGTGASLTGSTAVNLTKYKTVNDLVTFLNSQPGYVCQVGSTLFGQQLLTYKDPTGTIQTVLDKVTFNIGSQLGALPGRLKRDGWDMFNTFSTSVLTMLNPTAQAVGPAVMSPPQAGLPDVQPLFFLSGGARGSTSNANVSSALSAAEKVRCNFVIPLFSQDATADIAVAHTDPSSTYTIDAINAAVKSHVLALSFIKRRKNRQAFLSKRTSFSNALLAAANIASARCSMTFQDFKALDSASNITQFPPWMGAVFAAGMQSAGVYKPIVHKLINTSGVLMNDGSYSDQIDSQVEQALESGLLPAESAPAGGFRWVSDQTTYSVDNNFVYNSIQAVYVADLIAINLAQRLETAFVGQSLADISAGAMLANIKSIMADFKRQKWITSSDDAPAGFKNVLVQINGGVAKVSIEVKLAGALYFIPITTLVTPVQQTASV